MIQMQTRIRLELSSLKKAAARIMICAYGHGGGRMMLTEDKLLQLVADKYQKNYGVGVGSSTFVQSLENLVFTGWLTKSDGSKPLYGLTAEGSRATSIILAYARNDPAWEKYLSPSCSPNVVTASTTPMQMHAPYAASAGATT